MASRINLSSREKEPRLYFNVVLYLFCSLVFDFHIYLNIYRLIAYHFVFVADSGNERNL